MKNMDSMDPPTPSSSTAADNPVDKKPVYIHGKFRWPGGPPMRQRFSLPLSIMEYIAKNPSSPEAYLKLIQSCKYFYERNPVLVVNYLHLGAKKICRSDSCAQCFNTRFKCCLDFDLTKLKSSTKLWLTNTLDLQCDRIDEYAQNFAPLLRSKIFRNDLVRLYTGTNFIEYNNLKFFCFPLKDLHIREPDVVYENQENVTLYALLDAAPNVETLHYSFDNEISKYAAFLNNIQKVKISENLKEIYMHEIPEIFNIKVFYDLLKMERGDTRIQLTFADDISADYKRQLDGLIDTVIDFDYRNFIVEYRRQNEGKLRIMFWNSRFEESHVKSVADDKVAEDEDVGDVLQDDSDVTKPVYIRGKFRWPGGPPMKQKFSLPLSIMKYIAKNPSNPNLYQKLIKSCKYFFEQNPVLVVNLLNVGGTMICSSDNFLKCLKKNCECCVNLDLTKLKSPTKLWLTDTLFLQYDRIDVYIKNFAALLRSKIFRNDLVKLYTGNNFIEYDDFKFFASTAKYLDIRDYIVAYKDRTIVSFDALLDAIPNVKTFHFFFDNKISKYKTFFNNFQKAKFPENLKNLCLYDVPDMFDVPVFYGFLKLERGDTRISLTFADNIFEYYKRQLDALIDTVIDSDIHNFVIRYTGQNEEKLQIMEWNSPVDQSDEESESEESDEESEAEESEDELGDVSEMDEDVDEPMVIDDEDGGDEAEEDDVEELE